MTNVKRASELVEILRTGKSPSKQELFLTYLILLGTAWHIKYYNIEIDLTDDGDIKRLLITTDETHPIYSHDYFTEPEQFFRLAEACKLSGLICFNGDIISLSIH